MSDAKHIKQLLRERVEELAQYLFPSGKREGVHWCVGDITGAPGHSFKICIAGDKVGLWGDFADSQKHSRNLFDLWMQARNVNFKTALHEAAQWLGITLTTKSEPPLILPRQSGNGEKKSFDWESCVGALKPEHLVRLGNQRWYSRAFCSELREKMLIGLHKGCIAFPIHDCARNVVAVHYRLPDGSWRRYPHGKTAPLIIGELVAGEPVHVFESPWDGFAFMDESGERDGIIITRGSQNGKLVAGLIPAGATLYAWKQNDQLKNGKRAGDEWLKDVAAHAGTKVLWPKTPKKFKDLNDWTRAGATADDLLAAMVSGEEVNPAETLTSSTGQNPREPRIRFFSPCSLWDFEPNNDVVLVGDCHIMRGEVFVIGGEPGVGKSRAATQLGVSGATQRDWFGLTVYRQFRTMIVQTENGRYRLRQEFLALDCDEIEDWIWVSEPPPFGLTLSSSEFQADIRAALDSFKPDCVIFDPWNAAARDDKQRDYAETFDALRNLLPTGADKPALGIVAHTKKPQPNERRIGGTGLMHLLAGSYVLTSVPRCIFIMTRGSQDETDDSVVFFNPKNSNGENAPRSAWHRQADGFTPAKDFDWTEFDKPPDQRKIVTLDHVREVFGSGTKRLKLKDAAHALATLVGISENAAYNALKVGGRFSPHMSRDDGVLTFHSSKISLRNLDE
jgi:AAA domain-containing protein